MISHLNDCTGCVHHTILFPLCVTIFCSRLQFIHEVERSSPKVNIAWFVIDYNKITPGSMVIATSTTDKYRHRWHKFHKPQNTLVPYSTMPYSEHKCTHSCFEWRTVGYGTGECEWGQLHITHCPINDNRLLRAELWNIFYGNINMICFRCELFTSQKCVGSLEKLTVNPTTF